MPIDLLFGAAYISVTAWRWADILAATKWPAVSVPAMAKAAGLTLTKEKIKGEPTRYRVA